MPLADARGSVSFSNRDRQGAANVTIALMQLSDVFLGLGEEQFRQLMRSVSMGKLKTYQLFDSLKTRVHLTKLSSETLRKSAPRSWARLQEHDDLLASELAQAILVSHLD